MLLHKINYCSILYIYNHSNNIILYLLFVQVNLSVTLSRPMFPLLMEKMNWPPPGAMGPIFGEYLFVRFFARPGEACNDGYSWPDAKMGELLMQLRHVVEPDGKLVTPSKLLLTNTIYCWTYSFSSLIANEFVHKGK